MCVYCLTFVQKPRYKNPRRSKKIKLQLLWPWQLRAVIWLFLVRALRFLFPSLLTSYNSGVEWCTQVWSMVIMLFERDSLLLKALTHLLTVKFLFRVQKARNPLGAHFPKPWIVCDNRESVTITYAVLIRNLNNRPTHVILKKSLNMTKLLYVRLVREWWSFLTCSRLSTNCLC